MAAGGKARRLDSGLGFHLEHGDVEEHLDRLQAARDEFGRAQVMPEFASG